MSSDNQVPKKPSFGRRLWLAFVKLLWFVFRATLVLVVIAAIVFAIIYGGPILINDYLLKDVRENASSINAIQSQMEIESEHVESRLQEFQNQLDALEIQQDNFNQSFSELETRLESQLVALQDTQLDQATALESMATYQDTLEELQISLSALESQLTTIETDLQAAEVELNDQYTALDQTIVKNQEDIGSLSAQLLALDTTDTLRQELDLLKVMELITRVQVSIGQENIGLAKEDLTSAQGILSVLQSEVNADQADYLDEISQRLTQVIENLSDSPDLADDDLEVAWQLLLQGFPDEQATGDSETEATPTPTPEP